MHLMAWQHLQPTIQAAIYSLKDPTLAATRPVSVTVWLSRRSQFLAGVYRMFEENNYRID
jgi:hypothetical protein